MAKKPAKAAQSLKIPKAIIATGKFLQAISPKLAARFAARLFTTPIKHKTPRREHDMEQSSIKEMVFIEALQKHVMVYRYGTGERTILLVHGWSGRGTQLVKFAEVFAKAGYSILSFDAPAHGKSTGKTSIMPEFIATIFQLEKQFGPFEGAVGHSLGGMSLLNAVKRGLKLNRFVTIGSGDVIQDIIDVFTDQMQLKRSTGILMRQQFERKNHEAMDEYSSWRAAREIDIPVLVIHDHDDAEVPVSCAVHIHENLKHGELMLTSGLGHRKILGNPDVIKKTFRFITENNT